jgi:hypothetical protein
MVEPGPTGLARAALLFAAARLMLEHIFCMLILVFRMARCDMP